MFPNYSPFQAEPYSGALGRSAKVLSAAGYIGDNRPSYYGNPNLQPYLLKIRRDNWGPRVDYVVQDLRRDQTSDLIETQTSKDCTACNTQRCPRKYYMG